MSGGFRAGGSKSEARDALRARLGRLGPDDRIAAGERIRSAVLESGEWDRAGVLMMYAGDEGEPCLDGLISAGVAAGKTVCVPGIDWEEKRLNPRAVGSADDLIGGRHGIRVPGEGCAAVDPGEIGLVLVPGVGFDLGGGRLGRGGGFYDRFVAAWRGVCPMGSKALGVCFGVQVVDAVPGESHDARMDGLVTERGLTMVG